ncbi:hypothetical protein SLEP1_g51551 [Rubroshorea leprosula]|uniref:Uncharacterized protein n=1 Tax=Rubroshorea leprosula TaxID=152421 RepID=A0AAV5M4F6_9ROSI|nr:hypothetical protein SLEP1_g51551 [Rubroshorea leprosula]
MPVMERIEAAAAAADGQRSVGFWFAWLENCAILLFRLVSLARNC